MPRVYNKKKGDAPPGAVFIGRGSPWGNEWSHLSYGKATYKVATREEAIRCHREWLMSDPEMLARVKKELKGKDLVCYCAPLSCHGDTLLEVANS